MSEVNTIVAEARDRAGKGTARAVRLTGRIPGVVYGNKEAPALISMETKLLMREMHRGSFTSKLFDLEIGGTKIRVLPRDVQLHPVTDEPLHVDFVRVTAHTKTHVNVPVHFENHAASPGLKRGGVLNVVRHDIELSVSADSIPERIDVDLTGLDIGDSVHISAIKLPAGAHPTIGDRDFTIATIAAPTVKTDETAAEGEAAAV